MDRQIYGQVENKKDEINNKEDQYQRNNDNNLNLKKNSDCLAFRITLRKHFLLNFRKLIENTCGKFQHNMMRKIKLFFSYPKRTKKNTISYPIYKIDLLLFQATR